MGHPAGAGLPETEKKRNKGRKEKERRSTSNWPPDLSSLLETCSGPSPYPDHNPRGALSGVTDLYFYFFC